MGEIEIYLKLLCSKRKILNLGYVFANNGELIVVCFFDFFK